MKKQNENGITLIALIITIIVMLILVAVTVTTVVQSGLFGHASNATKKWDAEQNKESHIDEEFKTNIDGHEVQGLDNVVDSYVNTNRTAPEGT